MGDNDVLHVSLSPPTPVFRVGEKKKIKWDKLYSSVKDVKPYYEERFGDADEHFETSSETEEAFYERNKDKIEKWKRKQQNEMS